MIRAEIAVGLTWVAVISLILISIIFVSMMTHGRALLLGDSVATGNPRTVAKTFTVPLVFGLVACAYFGIVAWPLAPLLRAAANVIVR